MGFLDRRAEHCFKDAPTARPLSFRQLLPRYRLAGGRAVGASLKQCSARRSRNPILTVGSFDPRETLYAHMSLLRIVTSGERWSNVRSRGHAWARSEMTGSLPFPISPAYDAHGLIAAPHASVARIAAKRRVAVITPAFSLAATRLPLGHINLSGCSTATPDRKPI